MYIFEKNFFNSWQKNCVVILFDIYRLMIFCLFFVYDLMIG